MKANELRVGNFVITDEHYPYVDIDGIEENFVRIGHESYGYDAISPIPLTEDWLLRFGFRKISGEWELFPCPEIQIIVYNEGDYSGVMFYTRTIHSDYTPIYAGRHINNVHQLQNLYFALTGEELTLIKP